MPDINNGNGQASKPGIGEPGRQIWHAHHPQNCIDGPDFFVKYGEKKHPQDPRPDKKVFNYAAENL